MKDSTLKYYTYISNTKIDMLYEQIPSFSREKIGKELKIDLKLISATFSNNSSSETLYSKLRIVIEHLQKNNLVGTVDDPLSFFYGQMSLRWGPLSYNNQEFVYFSGVTNKTFLGLGGSLKHIIGTTGTSNVAEALTNIEMSDSSAPKIINSLASILASENDNLAEKKLPHEIYLVEQMAKNMKGHIEKFDFVAKRLMSGNRVDGKLILLGSPIYIALAN